MTGKTAALAALAAIGISAPAQAIVTISTAATRNMSCSGGTCIPTAGDAVLNATDLEDMLSAGNVTVSSTGSSVQAKDIAVKAPVKWDSASTLTLGAHRQVAVNRKIIVGENGGLSIATGSKGGNLSLGAKGRIEFRTLSSPLTINGISYTLIGDIKTLANAIAQNPGGAYALAADYDARYDGTYSTSPIPTTFTGILQGPGNTISDVSIEDSSDNSVGFFSAIAGEVSALRLANLQMNVSNAGYVGGLTAGSGGVLRGDSVSGSIDAVDGGFIGGLAGQNYCGLIDASSSAAKVSIFSTTGNGRPGVGGLVGLNDSCEYGGGGVIANSHAMGILTAQTRAAVGGLVGYLAGGSVSKSFATGRVNCAISCDGGGLVGYIFTADHVPSITNSYAKDSIAASIYSAVGGLIGFIDPDDSHLLVTHSYSTGSVSAGGTRRSVGGLIGSSTGEYRAAADCYWDTDTSGTDQGTGRGDASGITGLTTAQFQSGLPQGFNPAIWAEKRGVNGDLPYLIANPPPP